MAYNFVSDDGLVHSSDASFISLWNGIEAKQVAERSAWVRMMRDKGAKIITPDDGWVDRNAHTVYPPDYADQRTECGPGDLIALGGPDRWRIVCCTEVKVVGFLLGPRYSFDPRPMEASA